MRNSLTFLVGLGSTAFTASAAVTSINVTGYNRDVIVEAGAPASAAGVFDATMDGGVTTPTGGTWYAQGYNAGAPTTGLPAPGSTIVSLLAADHSYTFAPSYGPGNGSAGITPNAFVVGQGSGTPVIALTTPLQYSTLSLIGSAGHGPVSVNYTITFADTTTQTGTISAGDWFNGSAAFNANGRVTVNTGAFDNVNAGNPRLYTFDIAVTNTASKVNSVTLSSTSTTGTAAFFALSGTAAVPEPSSLLLSGLSVFGLLSFRRRASK
ncbi:MAG TPA: PEP-CTERM sorting domain-containing protein [Verrucomicrobiales bacterium]|jgi:hypothetical protein|nr:PEP-CTERM sorting domain-containing protein [Verrucomicrobiales bacterium]